MKKIDKVAKNLLLDHTCDNCEYLSISLINHCEFEKYYPKSKTCEFWKINWILEIIMDSVDGK